MSIGVHLIPELGPSLKKMGLDLNFLFYSQIISKISMSDS